MVVKGRKMMPSSGKMNVLNAASTRTGLAIQRISSASRGKSPPNIANKQPILITSCLILHCRPRQDCRVQTADQDVLTDGGVAVHRNIPSTGFSFAPALHEVSGA